MARRVDRKSEKSERTAEERAELRAERERRARDRPTVDDLLALGEYDGPFRQGDILALLLALAQIKQERERRGLSLTEVARRSGLDKGMVSRLENGKVLNPTMATLWKYAEAVGMTLRFSAETIPVGAGETAP